jgi:hypothetical protein
MLGELIAAVPGIIATLVSDGMAIAAAKEEDKAAAAERFHQALVASAGTVRGILDARKAARAAADAAIDAAGPAE